MPIEITDEVSSSPPTRDHGGRRIVNESVSLAGGAARVERDADVTDEVVSIGPRAGRQLSDRAKHMLENIDKHGSVQDAETLTAETVTPTVPAGTTAAGAPTQASPVEATPAGAAPAPEAAPAPDAAAEHIARADRLAEHNRKLLTEVETLKKRPTRGEMSAREKALDEAERGYIDDSVGSVRRLIATAIGVDDPKSKEVDAELTGLYQDLTERELAVAMDPASKAARETARTRRMIERDKRDRRAEADAAKPAEPDVSAKQDADGTALVTQRLAAANHAEKYPLLMSLSGDFDGLKPDELLWRAISRGIRAGELSEKTPDDQLIETVSKQIESHYQVLADKIVKARTPTSTAATTTQASPATESKAEAPGNGPRTITNASASVAPATPPAKKTEPTTETPPKFRNEAERRKALAAKHFGA
jgi:hypothetical protein